MSDRNKSTSKTDWSKIDAKSDEELIAAALADPDAQPIGPDDLKKMPRTPQVSVIRRAFRLSQEEFSEQFQVPVGTLRDWEQKRKEPDAAARAYLRVIAVAPDVVRRALAAGKSEAA